MTKVAVIPLAKFTSEPDTQLIADLATSVERRAVIKHLIKMAHECPVFGGGFLRDAADAIEKGEHHT